MKIVYNTMAIILSFFFFLSLGCPGGESFPLLMVEQATQRYGYNIKKKEKIHLLHEVIRLRFLNPRIDISHTYIVHLHMV